ncbi:TPA: hypothetical protein MC918_004449 [Klebsiella pneumoniae]|nr:MAG: hypothetical protein [Bacteriophage sp.]HBU7917275.1 hypothetical protein [Klebsiella pneumoniae]
MTDLADYKPTILTLHPYEMDVIFVWSPDEQQALAQYLRGHHDESWREWGDFVGKSEWTCRGLSWVGGFEVPTVIGVNLPLYCSGEDGQEMFRGAMATLSHEIFHSIMALCKNIMQYPEWDHDEPMAYMTGYIMRHALELMPAEMPDLIQMVSNAAK